MKSRTYPKRATTVPTAAVLTHVLHLLMYLLMCVRTYCTYYCIYCTITYYTYCCAVRSTYSSADIRMYICWKKDTAAEKIGTYCTYILYAGTAHTDVCTRYYMYLLLMHARILKKKNYQLLQVRTYCCTYVPTALTWYWCTYCTYCCSYR